MDNKNKQKNSKKNNNKSLLITKPRTAALIRVLIFKERKLKKKLLHRPFLCIWHKFIL